MNILKKTAVAAVLLLPLWILPACSSQEDDTLFTPPDLYRLGEIEVGDISVSAWSEAPLSVGYEIVWIEAHRNGERLDPLQVGLVPVMHMESHSHSSPHEPPGATRDSETGLYRAGIVFTMPGGGMGSWELQIELQEGGGESFEGVIPVDVEPSDRVRTTVSEQEARYILTLVEPSDPEVGQNELRVLLHRRASMHDFPAVTDADIAFEPWMPSMDHGSSNNVDPVHEENGHYSGIVNFNMTGDWELRFDITAGGEALDRQTFEITF